MVGAAFGIVAPLWITAETESTAAILQQCEPEAPAATQGPSWVIVDGLCLSGACNGRSTVGC